MMMLHKTLYLALLFIIFSSHMPAEAATLEVEWKDRLLSVRAEGVPLSGILESVSLRTGIDIAGFERLEEPCTITFSQLHLPEALKLLLAHVNYIVSETSTPEGDSLQTQVVVVGSGGTKPFEGNPDYKNAILQDTDPNSGLAGINDLLRRNPDQALEVLKDATLDENIDTRHMAFQQLSQMPSDKGPAAIRTRLTYPDPEIRMMAIEAMASRGEAFAREAAQSALHDNDESVRSMAEGIMHELEENEGR